MDSPIEVLTYIPLLESSMGNIEEATHLEKDVHFTIILSNHMDSSVGPQEGQNESNTDAEASVLENPLLLTQKELAASISSLGNSTQADILEYMLDDPCQGI